jgi:hypothetical protein
MDATICDRCKKVINPFYQMAINSGWQEKRMESPRFMIGVKVRHYDPKKSKQISSRKGHLCQKCFIKALNGSIEDTMKQFQGVSPDLQLQTIKE